TPPPRGVAPEADHQPAAADQRSPRTGEGPAGAGGEAVTSHTATASTVHEPLGKPGGPGLWHHKGMQLPAYIQHVAHHLLAQGHSESRAIEMAVGIVKNWAAGHDGHGNRVHPDVQAAAAKNIAQWDALKAKASGTRRAAVADNKPYGDVR